MKSSDTRENVLEGDYFMEFAFILMTDFWVKYDFIEVNSLFWFLATSVTIQVMDHPKTSGQLTEVCLWWWSAIQNLHVFDIYKDDKWFEQMLSYWGVLNMQQF